MIITTCIYFLILKVAGIHSREKYKNKCQQKRTTNHSQSHHHETATIKLLYICLRFLYVCVYLHWQSCKCKDTVVWYFIFFQLTLSYGYFLIYFHI